MRTIPLLVAAMAIAGCADLLPQQQVTMETGWKTFDEARAAVERLEPHRTTTSDLVAAGFDPRTNPNVELLNYSEILRRFPLPANVARIDAGLRECMEAGKACVGYAVDIKQERKERVGPFLLDLLSFRRETKSTGWTFNALVLLVDDQVVYALYGGKPVISQTDKTVEPLGPLQDWDGSGLIR
jgi:hypothetical protein